jgi:hypothetical protein
MTRAFDRFRIQYVAASAAAPFLLALFRAGRLLCYVPIAFVMPERGDLPLIDPVFASYAFSRF